MPVHVKSTPRWRKNQNKIITIPALHMVYYKSIVLVYIFLNVFNIQNSFIKYVFGKCEIQIFLSSVNTCFGLMLTIFKIFFVKCKYPF